ncbi:hypothetical protein F5X99DRAFT_427812 [Biscogniauxia marginata]|nr:hypothetical protein F5X99DRAFT_427812 [Biscogniauxia marginata]
MQQGGDEDSISFLLNALNSQNSQSGNGQPPQQPPPPQPPLPSPEWQGWDALLTRINWKDNSWRQFNFLDQIPWSQLKRDTVNYLAQQWEQFDKAHPEVASGGQLNPATVEQLRRFSARGSTPAQQAVQTRAVMEFFTPDAGTQANAADMSEDYGQPKGWGEGGDGVQGGDGLPDAFYTVGYEIEFLVAAAAVGQDPLPDDGRWLDAGLAGVPPDSIKFQDRVKRALANELNAHAEVICTIKNEDEGGPKHDKEMGDLHRMAEGGVPKASGPVADQAAVDNVTQLAFEHALTYFFHAGNNVRLHQATNADIRRFVDLASKTPAATALAAGDQAQLCRQLRRRLRIAAYLSQSDPAATQLPGMKHRYRSWSVSRLRGVRPSAAQTAYYANAPDAAAAPPVESYKWLAAKVSSPVMSVANLTPGHEALGRVCHVLRDRFRIHRDLPGALPLSTQVVVSHSHGLTLLELKKLATLVRLLEEDLRRLHRRERTEPTAWRACASVATWSSLGGASFDDAARLRRDPAAPAWRVLPRPARPTRDYLTALMERHVPAADLFSRGTVADEVYYRAIWLYTSVDQLSRAVLPNRPGVQLGVMVKCAGKGRRTAADRTAADDARDPLPFVEVDKQRGVVEFRYMQASLNPQHMYNWAAVCAHLVSMAKDTDAAQFRERIGNMIRGGGVLAGLRVPADIVQAFKAGVENSGTGYFNHPDAPVDYHNPFYAKP